MKHLPKITIMLILLFILAQLVGLIIINQYASESSYLEIEQPEVNQSTSYIQIGIAIVIVTIFALILIKLKARRVWKSWFFLSIMFGLTVAFAAFVHLYLAMALAIVFAYFKIIKHNIYIHNIAEVFVYGGIAALFIPILNLWSISILFILIAIYDAIAVWKTKHMITMAKFQAKEKVFAGLLIPYKRPSKSKTAKLVSVQQAILGGGDIGFPLLFSGVIFMQYGLVPALISTAFATLALSFLFYISKKDKFYPAMPFIAAGCFLSLAIIIPLF